MMTRQQAIDLFQSDDLIALGMAAEAIRDKLHPERIVSYCLEAESTASAEVLFRHGETIEQRLDALEALRSVPHYEQRFAAVLPVVDAKSTTVEYLKMLALSRIYLDTIPHLQTSPAVGLKVCQIALRFGANDIHGAEGQAPNAMVSEEQIRRLIRDAGFIPKQRDPLFRTLSLA